MTRCATIRQGGDRRPEVELAGIGTPRRLDPGCAMCWWGIALAHGPNINAPMSPEAGAEAWNAIHHARELAPEVTDAEKRLIEALATRYAADPGAERSYREDLLRFPDNGWSLLGLARSLEAQGREAEAREAHSAYRAAWTDADVELSGSRIQARGSRRIRRALTQGRPLAQAGTHRSTIDR